MSLFNALGVVAGPVLCLAAIQILIVNTRLLPPELLEELMRYSAPLSRRIIGALAQRLMRMNQSAAG
jgi:membrane protein